MKLISTTAAFALALNLNLSAGEFTNSDVNDHSNHDHSQHAEDYLGFNLTRGWLDPVAAHDHSSGGHDGRAKLIHPLTIEAAFNDSDLFVSYAFNSFDDADEHEIEIELELAITRRFGVVLETGYAFETEGGSTENGFGDLEIAGRFVLAEYKNFILTAGLGLGIPTGEGEFSEDQLTVEPSLLAWTNLGNGFSLNTVIGAEFKTRSNESEIFLNAAIVKDLGGAFAATLESRNAVALRGDERGDIESEATVGLVYQATSNVAIRGGWSFPVENDEFSNGAVLSLNYSF